MYCAEVLELGYLISILVFRVAVKDSDDRAVGYVAGSAPNRWGLLRDGTSILDLFSKPNSALQQHRVHKLFAPVVLLMLKEVRVGPRGGGSARVGGGT